jgi:hypothetical protein
MNPADTAWLIVGSTVAFITVVICITVSGYYRNH